MGRIRLFGSGRAALLAVPPLAMLALLARPADAQTCPCPAQSGTNYRSIGTDGTVLHSGLAEATIAVGTNTIDFLTANLPLDTIGVGDRITLDPGGTPDVYYILSVENRAQVTIHGTATMSHANVDYNVTRAYTSLGAWETARDDDLVGAAARSGSRLQRRSLQRDARHRCSELERQFLHGADGSPRSPT